MGVLHDLKDDYRLAVMAHKAFTDYCQEHRLMRPPMFLEIIGTILAWAKTRVELKGE